MTPVGTPVLEGKDPLGTDALSDLHINGHAAADGGGGFAQAGLWGTAREPATYSREGPLLDQLEAYFATLIVPSGDHAGQPFTLLGWQRRFLASLVAQPEEDAAVTMGRGGGKTGFCAALACAYIDPQGPLHRPRIEVVVVSASHPQARLLLGDIRAYLESRYGVLSRDAWQSWDSPNAARLMHRGSRAEVHLTGSDASRLHSRRPLLILWDEPAAMAVPKAEAVEATGRTSLGKVAGSRMIMLGTQAADEDHPFARGLRDFAVRQVHAAAADAPLTMRSVRRALPDLDHHPSLKRRVERELREARRDPFAELRFRALRLNAGTRAGDDLPLVTAGDWRRHAAREAPAEGPVVWGADLGGGTASSAVACYWPQSGRLEGLTAFPAIPDLAKRAKRASVGSLFTRAAAEGSLVILGEHTVPTADLFAEALTRWPAPDLIAYDRWRADLLRQGLYDAGVPYAEHVPRGMGFKDGGADVEEFIRALLDGAIAAPPNLALAGALADCHLVHDPAGNPKIAKASEGGRRRRGIDDLAVAAVLAVAVGRRAWARVSA